MPCHAMPFHYRTTNLMHTSFAQAKSGHALNSFLVFLFTATFAADFLSEPEHARIEYIFWNAFRYTQEVYCIQPISVELNRQSQTRRLSHCSVQIHHEILTHIAKWEFQVKFIGEIPAIHAVHTHTAHTIPQSRVWSGWSPSQPVEPERRYIISTK